MLDWLAVIVTAWLAVTFLWDTVKVPVSFPAGTNTVAGTVAAAVLELFNEIEKPPVGAGLLRVTVPLTTVFATPCTVLGDTDNDVRVGGSNVIATF